MASLVWTESCMTWLTVLGLSPISPSPVCNVLCEKLTIDLISNPTIGICAVLIDLSMKDIILHIEFYLYGIVCLIVYCLLSRSIVLNQDWINFCLCVTLFMIIEPLHLLQCCLLSFCPPKSFLTSQN